MLIGQVAGKSIGDQGVSAKESRLEFGVLEQTLYSSLRSCNHGALDSRLKELAGEKEVVD